MVSPSLAGITGSILAPILPQLALDKLMRLVDYLSRDEPSSSSEVDKLQQLENEREALEDANIKLKMMQSEVRNLHNRDKRNMRLIRINNEIRDVSYDIQDLEDDLEYMELQRKVEEINMQDEADNSPSKKRKRWSWFPWATGQSTCLKRCRHFSSQSLKLSTDDLVNRMRSIVKQINCIDSKMNTEIKVDQLFQQIALNGVYDPWGQHQVKKNHGRETTSSIKERELYGRDREIKRLTKLLKKPIDCVGNISVVSVLGMGGIGKTALAAFVFNNQEIEDHFDNKAWICVTENYDKFRIIKEIIDLLSADDDNITLTHDTTSLELLEARLKRCLTGKKFLLVLDDVWSTEWQQLIDSLGSTQAEIVKILVTCRNPEVLGSFKGINGVSLIGLHYEDCWSFFMSCAFADKNPHNYPKKLHSIGKKIMHKLKGSPLAIKTVGRLLGCNLTKKHWKDVLESDFWKLETDTNGIMSALALSYYHLPQHLQLCFAFCSVLPKYFQSGNSNVVDMWMAHGYIQENRSSTKTMKDIGKEYWDELEAMCFLPSRRDVFFYMHPLMHDLAHSVSHGEIYTYKGEKDEKISKNVRHLCASTLFHLGTVCETNNLRTLVLYRADDMCALLNHGALKRIRVLVIINDKMEELPDAIGNLKHLQYLDLEKTNIKSIPESICVLYQLRVLKLPRLHTIPSMFHNLINLQTCNLFKTGVDRRTLVYRYRVKRGGNHMISQLRNMNDLRGSFFIEGLENVDSREEAMKSKLKEKCHIDNLYLGWKNTADGCEHDAQEEVLESLQPHPNLTFLYIYGYMGSKWPSWLKTLKKLRWLKLNKCRNWARLPAALGLLPYLQKLYLFDIENITIEGDDTVTHMFTSLEMLQLKKATITFEGMSSSSSSSSLTTATCRKLFPRLRHLNVEECDGVHGLPWQMFSTLEDLTINASRGFRCQMPMRLENLNSLTSLGIEENMGFLLDVLHLIPSLRRLTISKCQKPVSLPALGHLSFLRNISLEEVEVIVGDVIPVFPFLRTLQLKKASMIFQNMPSSSSSSAITVQNHNCFPCLDSLTIEGCDEVNALHFAMLSTLKYVSMISCLGLDDQLSAECLNGLSSLTNLKLTSVKIKSFPAEVMAALHALKYLHLEDCIELISVEGLQALPSLRHLTIIKCPQFGIMFMEPIATEHGVFFPKLSYICIESCENMESLPAWLPCLPILRVLRIIKCPKFHSLPEGGLPSSLQTLMIIECAPDLIKRCQQEGSHEWLMNDHIPYRNYRL